MKHIIFTLFVVAIVILSCKTDTKQQLNQQKAEESDSKILEQGKSITSATVIALSSELQKAMKAGGVSEAVQYCNIEAMPVTDSLTKKYGVDIKRTSDKIRNTQNKASVIELETIIDYKEQLVLGEVLEPKVVIKDDQRIFYAPIIVNDLCLKCHGQKDEIIDYEVISNLYPSDQATGYVTGDLRGIWSVTFIN